MSNSENENNVNESEEEENVGNVPFCKNKNISLKCKITLHHFGFATNNINMKDVFGIIKIVIISSNPSKLKLLANKIIDVRKIVFPLNLTNRNIAEATEHTVLYKIGNILLASYDIGVSSMLMCLNDLAKILYQAKAKDVMFIKYGTSMGIGVEPGSVVITSTCFNSNLEEHMEMSVFGKILKRSAKINPSTIKELLNLAINMKSEYQIITGATLSTLDFYEEQCRLDGAICIYTEEEKNQYLKKIYEMGVRNMEFDSLAFASFCQRVKIKGAIINVTLADYLSSDKTIASANQLNEWLKRPEELILQYIQNL